MSASLNEVSLLVEAFLEKKKKIDEIEETQIKPLNKEITEIQSKLIKLLEENNLEKFSGASGSVRIYSDKKVSMPDGDDKVAFIEFMKEIGEWDTYATIHHGKLNSWYSEKLSANPIFTAPGLGLPKEHKYLKRQK